MNNLFLQVFRNRLMVDRGIAEQTYLPFFISMLQGAPTTLAINKPQFGGTKEQTVDLTRPDLNIRLFDRSLFQVGAEVAFEKMDEAQEGSVLVIPIIGEFLKYGTMCSYGANEIAPAIRKAGDVKNISAVVLDFDSGGGAENAVPLFIEAIRYVQSKGKPVVAHGDLCASAAYYAASFCDYILADNEISSAFGSIGAFVSFADFSKQLEMAGVKITQFYATQSNLKNEAYRALTENEVPDSKPLIDKMLDPAVDRFIATCKKNRNGKISEDSDVWKGALVESEEIVKCGLADDFGTLNDAIQVAVKLADFKKMNF